MAKIIIGREYRSEFESICRLYEGRFLSSDIHIVRAGNGVIQTETHTYVYKESEHGVNGTGDDAGKALCFTADGASWFAPLRGAAFDSGNADWKQLIMDVAADYHKHYSLITFRQRKDDTARENDAVVAQRFKTGFVDRVFAPGGAFTMDGVRSAAVEKLYAVSMRLEINGGGESAPVLGKICFCDRNGELEPVPSDDAEEIDGYIASAAPADDTNDTDDTKSEIVDLRLVTRVFAALERTFGEGRVAAYVSFGERYRQIVGDLLAQLATSEIKTLECTNVKVLGIAYVEWERSEFHICRDGKEALTLSVGVGGAVTLTCANCRAPDRVLVKDNVVLFPTGVRAAVPKADCTVQAPQYTEAEIALMREKALLSEHLSTVTCRENPRNAGCRRTVCATQTVDTPAGRKCKACRYPEIMYKDVFDPAAEGRYTPSLGYAADRMALIDGKTAVCACCKRSFSAELVRGGLCAFCRRSDNGDTAKKLYRKYSGMLSPIVRIKHLFRPKYCREDDNILLFELGGERYVFDMLNIRAYGFVKKPTKYKRKGGAE